MTLAPADYPVFKVIGTATVFAFALTVQFLRPYHGRRAAILANWRVNFPLALLNVVLASIVGSRWLVGGDATLQGVVASVLILDFSAFAFHIAYHRVPLLWRLHVVHHTDRCFDVSTAVRFHPGEVLLSLAARLGIIGALGLPLAGVLVFEVTFAALNFFEHGDIRLGRRLDSALGWVFLTPALHRKHHSVVRRELDSNFGTIFSFWDRLFRTRTAGSPGDVVTVGLPDQAGDATLAELLKMPLGKKW